MSFRRRLETHDLGKGLFAAIDADLAARGLLRRDGTRVDATLNLFGHRKVRYRGLAQNGHQLYTLFGLAKVVIAGRTAPR